MAAGIAAGIYKDYFRCNETYSKNHKTIQPRPEYADIHKEKYAAYRAVIDGLNGTWKYFRN